MATREVWAASCACSVARYWLEGALFEAPDAAEEVELPGGDAEVDAVLLDVSWASRLGHLLGKAVLLAGRQDADRG